MLIISFPCISILVIASLSVTRLIILAWWPTSGVAIFLTNICPQQRCFTSVSSDLEQSYEKLQDEKHAIGSPVVTSIPSVGLWERTISSDIEFLRELDAQTDRHSATIAEILVILRKGGCDRPSPAITVDRREARLFTFESAAKIFDSKSLPVVDLLDIEERLARCFYIPSDTSLRIKVPYCWIVAMYRLYNHVGLVSIIDQLDSIMNRLETAQTLGSDWNSLISKVMLVRTSKSL